VNEPDREPDEYEERGWELDGVREDQERVEDEPYERPEPEERELEYDGEFNPDDGREMVEREE